LDENGNQSFIHWEISRGDLVRVVNHIFTHNGTEIEKLYGIVVDEIKNNQIMLFPEVNIYLFKTKTTKSFTAGSVEIISHAKQPSTY